ncbi:MAG: hypothetical protein R3F43_26430 [bacterium]
MTLEAALALAEAQAPAVVAARAREAEARAREAGAAAWLRDPLEIEAWAGPRLGTDATDLEVGVGQVPGGPARGADGGGASRAEGAEAEAAEARRQALGAVAGAFVLARHHESAPASPPRPRAWRRRSTRPPARQAAGDAAGLDVHLAAVAEAQAQAELAVQQVERDEALEELRRLLAAAPGDVPAIGGPALPRGCADGPMVDRPGLRALDAAVAEAEAEGRLGRRAAGPIGGAPALRPGGGVDRVLGAEPGAAGLRGARGRGGASPGAGRGAAPSAGGRRGAERRGAAGPPRLLRAPGARRRGLRGAGPARWKPAWIWPAAPTRPARCRWWSCSPCSGRCWRRASATRI